MEDRRSAFLDKNSLAGQDISYVAEAKLSQSNGLRC